MRGESGYQSVHAIILYSFSCARRLVYTLSLTFGMISPSSRWRSRPRALQRTLCQIICRLKW